VQWLRFLHDGPLSVVTVDAAATAVPQPPALALPEVPLIAPAELAAALGTVVVFDLRSSAAYAAGHLPGSIHARREHLPFTATATDSIVLVGDSRRPEPAGAADLQTAATGYLPHFAARDLLEQGYSVRVLDGGPTDVGVALSTDDARYAGEIVDRTGPPPFGPARDAWYREYFDWEYALLPTSAGDPDFDFDARDTRAAT
jgi:rhodanese-related sulfurtransferase